MRKTPRTDVPMGESRWLIEGTRYYPTRRTYWTGLLWRDQWPLENSIVHCAARFFSKVAAEETIKYLKQDGGVHDIEAREHLFQCGPDLISAEHIEKLEKELAVLKELEKQDE